MTRYGYVRVSSKDQNEARQLEKMRELGIADKNIFIDKASGKDLEREQYQKLISLVEEGDEIIFDSLDRLGRDYDDLTIEWRRLTREVGCDLKALDLEFFDSALFRSMGDIGKCVEDMLLSLLAYVAQTERKKNRQRQAEGIAIAKSLGKYKGKPKTIFPAELIDAANKALREEGKSAAAKILNVSRITVYRMIEDGRLKSA